MTGDKSHIEINNNGELRMPFPANPAAQIQKQRKTIRQESNGSGSPNVVTGSNRNVVINGGPRYSDVSLPSHGPKPKLPGIQGTGMVVQLGGNFALVAEPATAFVVLRIPGENSVCNQDQCDELAIGVSYVNPRYMAVTGTLSRRGFGKWTVNPDRIVDRRDNTIFGVVGRWEISGPRKRTVAGNEP